MNLITDWQYQYIEKSLYNFSGIFRSDLVTELKMAKAIIQAKIFFHNQIHENMMIEFYFKADEYRKRMSSLGHMHYVCEDVLFISVPSGYRMRKEIVYKVAMYCYQLGVFKE